MLSSYPVNCPHANCTWTGSLVPSLLRGGPDSEVAPMHRAWFRCPRCQGDWEVRITKDKITTLPALDRNQALPDTISSRPARAIAFDVDTFSLARLRDALPGWDIQVLNDATPDSLTDNWVAGAADLLVVKIESNVTEALDLCRFLSGLTSSATVNGGQDSEGVEVGDEFTASAPGPLILVLAHPGQEHVVAAALEAGARSCLMLPIHPSGVTGVLAHARAGNQPGRHTLNLNQSQDEDPWRDDGGQG